MLEKELAPYINPRFQEDPQYRQWHSRVLNLLPRRNLLGIPIPQLRRFAAQLVRQGKAEEYLEHLQTEWALLPDSSLAYEELLLWGMLIHRVKAGPDRRLQLVRGYVPAIDSWAVCDFFCGDAKWVRRMDRALVWDFLAPYFTSTQEFELRFALVMMLEWFLDEEGLEKVFEWLQAVDFAKVKSAYSLEPAPYYALMAAAWLLAEANARFREKTEEFVNKADLPSALVKLYERKVRESRKCTPRKGKAAEGRAAGTPGK